MSSNELDVLVDANVNAVVFVMDYLQIQFDVGTATFWEFPYVNISESSYQFGDTNYRNALCEFIGEKVSSIQYRDNESFRLNFRIGDIDISLLPEKYISPEMVVIDLPDKSIVF